MQQKPIPTVGASEHDSKSLPEQTRQTSLPGVLGWLARRLGAAKATGTKLLSSFAVAMRASSVSDFYATKYLAKPQQWLTTALGPLIAGFKRVEEEQEKSDTPLTIKALALRKLRTAIFAANRSVWISSCEACIFLETGGTALLSHADVVVHGHKGLFMMHECKRILNKELAGQGLWQTDLAKTQAHPEGEILEIQPGSTEKDGAADASNATEPSDAEDDGTEPTHTTDGWFCRARRNSDGAGAAEHAENTDSAGAAEHAENDDGAIVGAASDEREIDEGAPRVQEGTAEGVDGGQAAEEKTDAQTFQITISLRDDWLHRGDALQDLDLHTYAEYIQRDFKPVCGTDRRKTLTRQIFAFDAHYKLAQVYMQVLKAGESRSLARFNMAKCERENVNGGEHGAAHRQ